MMSSRRLYDDDVFLCVKKQDPSTTNRIKTISCLAPPPPGCFLSSFYLSVYIFLHLQLLLLDGCDDDWRWCNYILALIQLLRHTTPPLQLWEKKNKIIVIMSQHWKMGRENRRACVRVYVYFYTIRNWREGYGGMQIAPYKSNVYTYAVHTWLSSKEALPWRLIPYLTPSKGLNKN